MTFSIDYQSLTVTSGTPEGFDPPPAPPGVPIGAGDILTPTVPGPFGPNPPSLFGPLPPPGIFVDSGAPTAATLANPLYGGAGRGLGIAPSTLFPFPSEVDALSYGRDEEFFDQLGSIVFSVDEFASGIPGAAPDVASESTPAALGEAAADVFRYNGVTAPTPPSVFSPDTGDNLDALDIGTTPMDLKGPIFVSLDAAFVDPLEAFASPPNSGTAAANGFVGGDILVSVGGALVVYAGAGSLGLDLVPMAGMDSDDLDALILIESGDGVFAPDDLSTPTLIEGPDIVLFSVRRNSAVIGMPDSLYGAPIEEGDILTIPFTGLAAVSPFPAIFIGAEALGLLTARSGMSLPSGNVDDLDALSVAVIPIPASLPLMASAVGGLVVLRRRRTA